MGRTEEGTGEGDGTGVRARQCAQGEEAVCDAGGESEERGTREKEKVRGGLSSQRSGPGKGRAGPDCPLTCSCCRSQVLGKRRGRQFQAFRESDSSWRVKAEVSPQQVGQKGEHSSRTD